MRLGARSVSIEFCKIRIVAPAAERPSESQIFGYLADRPTFSPVIDTFGDHYHTSVLHRALEMGGTMSNRFLLGNGLSSQD